MRRRRETVPKRAFRLRGRNAVFPRADGGKKHMKILITSDWYAPTLNGVVISILNLKHSLERRGHEVRVLTLSDSPRSYCRDGVTYIGSFNAGKIYPNARIRLAPARALLQDLVDWQPDIVHSQCEFCTFFLARKIAELSGAPLIHTYHTVYEDYTHYFSPSERLGRRTMAAFAYWIGTQIDCYVAPTRKIRDLLDGYGVKCPVAVIPTGLDLSKLTAPVPAEKRSAMRAELGIPADRIVLAAIGRLAAEKNTEELISFMADCRDLPVTLLLVGDGPNRAALEAMTKKLGLEDSVLFTGMVPHDDVGLYYHLGDVFVNASTSEAQGLTYNEALAAGLPALCRADPVLNGVIEDGVNGWQYHDEDEFREKLALLVDDAALRQRMAAAAAASGQLFSADNFGLRAEKLYLEQLRFADNARRRRELAS